MNRSLGLASLRYSLRHPWQFGLSLLGIALGVAVVIAVDLANESARRAFELSTETVMGRTTHQIVGGPSGLPDGLYTKLRAELGVRTAAPVVEAFLPALDYPGRTFMLLGLDPLADEPFRPFTGGASGSEIDLGALMTQPASVLIAAPTARRLGLKVSDRLRLRFAGKDVAVTIVGRLDVDDSVAERGLEDVLIADIATAQELSGQIGRLTRIDLIVPDDRRGESLLQRIERALPAGASLESAGARTGTAAQMTRAFNLNLVMLGLLALVVGMFLIYNTVTFSVVQRRSLIGNLRALGVTRGEIFTLVLSEACAIGLVGAVMGMGLGIALATVLVELVTRTINDLYFTLTVRELAVTPLLLGKGALLGVGAAIIAALLPAWEATRVVPRAAISRSAIEARVRRLVPRAAAAGLALIALSALLLALPGGDLGAGFLALFGVVAGGSLLAPAATLGFVRVLQPLAGRIGGSLGPMSVRGVSASLSRTAVAIAALMVALSATVGVGVMVDSFRQSVARWLETTLRADLYVRLPDAGERSRLDPALIARLGALPGVVDVSMGRRVEVPSPEGPTSVLTLRMAAASYRGFHLIEGESERAWEAFDREGAVLVTEPYAYRRGLHVGDTITLSTDRGPQAFTIAAVFRDYGSDRGGVLMSRATFDRFWDVPGFTTIGLYAAAGTDLDRLIESVRDAAGDKQRVRIMPNQAIRELSLEVFDRTFTITIVLRILATSVAFVGVLSALMALQLERAREIAVMRAQGLTAAQVWGVVQAQTGVMGLIAGLLSIPLGLALALMLIFVINRRSFGWSLDVYIDPGIPMQAVALALVAALLAGLYPAMKMARTSPALALREE